MDPLTITLTIDLDAEIATRWAPRLGGYGPDGEPYEADPPDRANTFAEIVVDLAARQVVAGIEPDARKQLAERVRQIRDEVIRERVEPLIVEALNGPIVTTNSFGEAIAGTSTTLREIIVGQVTQQLRAPQPSNGMRDRQATLVERIIAEQITKVVGAELAQVVADTKALLVSKVKDSTAELLSKAIADGLRR